MPYYKHELGQRGEAIAEKYLLARNYQIIDRHWHGRYGEIDLVASAPDARTLVFIEVKTRNSESFCAIEETIDRRKLERLGLAIGRYVAERRFRGPYRLDAVLILLGIRTRIRHIQNIPAD